MGASGRLLLHRRYHLRVVVVAAAVAVRLAAVGAVLVEERPPCWGCCWPLWLSLVVVLLMVGVPVTPHGKLQRPLRVLSA